MLQRMGKVTFTAVYLKVPEGYIAFVEDLPGTNTQGETPDEARANLEETISIVPDCSGNCWKVRTCLAKA